MTLGFISLDPVYYLFILPGLLLGIYAQLKLKSTFGRYSRVAVGSRMTGAQAAREILDRAGLSSMPVEEVRGQLSDHYDPLRKRLCLSSDNYHGASIAAVGVAAHEAGHALQHKNAYGPLKFRMTLVPITNFASSGAFVALLGGMFLNIFGLMILGIVLFGIVTFFQLVTLPVEYDASRRAKQQLLRLGLITQQEQGSVGRVLNAAALTYVAALVAAVLQLMHLVLLARDD